RGRRRLVESAQQQQARAVPARDAVAKLHQDAPPIPFRRGVSHAVTQRPSMPIIRRHHFLPGGTLTHPPQNPPPPSHPPRPPKPNTRLAWGIGAGVVLLLIAVAAIGAVVQGGDETQAEPTVRVPSTWATLPSASSTKAPVATPSTSVPGITRTATVTPSPDFPTTLDPRCSAAPPELVEKIAAKLKNPNRRVAHAVLVTPVTGTPFIGASIVAADGLMVERSDVWVNTKSRGMTAATSGA